MNIIGFYKTWTLVEKDGKYFVVNRPDKKSYSKEPRKNVVKCSLC